MAFWTYILQCSDRRYYTGHTDNLELRITQHLTGGYCVFTSRRRPIHLLWHQEFPSRLEALEAERRIKAWSRAKKEALIRGDWDALSFWSKPPKERPSSLVGPERPPQEAAEGLATNGGEDAQTIPFVSSEVETRCTVERPSTALGTNGGRRV